MKSAGKTALIESDSLRGKIQNYYRLFDEVVKQENMNNSSIVNTLERIASSINIGHIIEIGMPERWNTNVGKFNINYFDTTWNNLTENQKTVFISNSSRIKAQIMFSNAVRFSLYQEGVSLSKLMDDTLENKK